MITHIKHLGSGNAATIPSKQTEGSSFFWTNYLTNCSSESKSTWEIERRVDLMGNAKDKSQRTKKEIRKK